MAGLPDRHARAVPAAAVGALLAYRFIKKATPPKPELAIEEAHLIRETVAGSQPDHRGTAVPEKGEADGKPRSPEEIRRSIEANRAELGMAVEKLRQEVAVVTDWRGQLMANKKQVLIGAARRGLRARRRDRRRGPAAPRRR